MPTRRNKTKEKIATKVRELRKQRRWTQAELAKRLGLSQSRLSEIERGAGFGQRFALHDERLIEQQAISYKLG